MYIVWAIINILLVSFFIILCFNITKNVKQNIGTIPAFIFVVLLLTICIHVGDKYVKTTKNNIWEFKTTESLKNKSMRYYKVKIDENLLHENLVTFRFIKDKNQSSVPVSAYAGINGFISGTEWRIDHLDIIKTNKKNVFHYKVLSTAEWNLYLLHIFSFSKEYEGTVTLE